MDVVDELEKIDWKCADGERLATLAEEYETEARHQDWLYEKHDTKLMWLAGAAFVFSAAVFSYVDTRHLDGYVLLMWLAGLLWLASGVVAAFATRPMRYSTSAIIPQEAKGVASIGKWLATGDAKSFHRKKIKELATTVERNRSSNQRKANRLKWSIWLAIAGAVAFAAPATVAVVKDVLLEAVRCGPQ